MYRHAYINKTLKHDYWGVLLTNTDDSAPLPSRSSENWQSLPLRRADLFHYLSQLTQAEPEPCFRSLVFFIYGQYTINERQLNFTSATVQINSFIIA